MVILLCIAGGWYYSYKSNHDARMLEIQKQELELKMNRPGTVVYAIRDVPAGKFLSNNDVIERKIPQSKIPSAALTRSSDGVGRLLGYGITKGQIISGYDFEPPLPGLSVSIVMSSRSLEKGTILKRSDLAIKWTVVPPDGKIKPRGAIRSIDAAIGKKLKTSVGKEVFISEQDFYPN